ASTIARQAMPHSEACDWRMACTAGSPWNANTPAICMAGVPIPVGRLSASAYARSEREVHVAQVDVTHVDREDVAADAADRDLHVGGQATTNSFLQCLLDDLGLLRLCIVH